MIKQFFYGSFLGGRAAGGLLALRIIAGLGLVAHGFPKIQKPFSWMGPGAPMPGFLQFLGAFSEFFGGLALIVGLLTPLAALGIIATMLFAAFGAHGKDPFVASGPGPSKEPALSYFIAALTLFMTGPGTLSLDNLLFGRKRGIADPRNPTASATEPSR